MFDLESNIAAWRQSFQQQELDEPTLAELESHLREAFSRLQRGKTTDEQAWEQAVAGLGDASAIATEFLKTRQFVWWPTLFASGLVAFGGTAAIAVALKRGVHTSNDLILLAHVAAISVGYCAMFATGLLAICSVLQRAAKCWDAQREARFCKYSLIFAALASITVAVGIVLASLWASMTRHALWSWDPREIGAALVFPWALCQVEVFRRAGFSGALRLTAGFVANAVTAVAWFGPLILWARHSYGSEHLFPKLAGFVTLNAMLAMAAWFVPGAKAAEPMSVKAD